MPVLVPSARPQVGCACAATDTRSMYVRTYVCICISAEIGAAYRSWARLTTYVRTSLYLQRQSCMICYGHPCLPIPIAWTRLVSGAYRIAFCLKSIVRMGAFNPDALCPFCQIRNFGTALFVQNRGFRMGEDVCQFGRPDNPFDCYHRALFMRNTALGEPTLIHVGSAWQKLLAKHYEVPLPDSARLQIFGYLWDVW